MTIKNGDLPASPVCYDARMMGAYSKGEAMGLTKREYFAAMAMQGLLAGVHGDSVLYSSSHDWVKDIAGASIEFSDELLAELERTK